MSEKRFSWKTEKLQHLNDEVLVVVDNENKEWKGHILNIVDLLNKQQATINELKEENKKLREEWEFSFRTELAHHRFAEKELQEKIRDKQATIEGLKEKLCELGVSDVKINGKRIDTGLEGWLE